MKVKSQKKLKSDTKVPTTNDKKISQLKEVPKLPQLKTDKMTPLNIEDAISTIVQRNSARGEGSPQVIISKSPRSNPGTGRHNLVGTASTPLATPHLDGKKGTRFSEQDVDIKKRYNHPPVAIISQTAVLDSQTQKPPLNSAPTVSKNAKYIDSARSNIATGPTAVSETPRSQVAPTPINTNPNPTPRSQSRQQTPTKINSVPSTPKFNFSLFGGSLTVEESLLTEGNLKQHQQETGNVKTVLMSPSSASKSPTVHFQKLKHRLSLLEEEKEHESNVPVPSLGLAPATVAYNEDGQVTNTGRRYVHAYPTVGAKTSARGTNIDSARSEDQEVNTARRRHRPYHPNSYTRTSQKSGSGTSQQSSQQNTARSLTGSTKGSGVDMRVEEVDNDMGYNSNSNSGKELMNSPVMPQRKRKPRPAPINTDTTADVTPVSEGIATPSRR